MKELGLKLMVFTGDRGESLLALLEKNCLSQTTCPEQRRQESEAALEEGKMNLGKPGWHSTQQTLLGQVLSWGTSVPVLQFGSWIQTRLLLHMRNQILGQLSSGLALLQCRNSTTNICRGSPSTLDAPRVVGTDEKQRWFILQTLRSVAGRLQIHQQGQHHSVVGQHLPQLSDSSYHHMSDRCLSSLGDSRPPQIQTSICRS